MKGSACKQNFSDEGVLLKIHIAILPGAPLVLHIDCRLRVPALLVNKFTRHAN